MPKNAYIKLPLKTIRIEVLLDDLCAAAFEMGVCQVGLEITQSKPEEKAHKQIQARYDGNENQVKVLKAEIKRRVGK